MANENITIEDLAGMIKRGFDKVDERFDLVDNRLERIETRLENLVHKNEFEKLEMRVKILEEALAIKK
ncbi:hypothetical protein KAU51_02465 [Candidatus Parcubacteria bacterium]|nr:hypothetical protein [Candidatus Parcubacteria bacterium]